MELNFKNIKKILFLVFAASLIVFAVFNMAHVVTLFSKVLTLLSPIIAAFCIAFVLNVLLRALENKVFSFMDKSKHRFVLKLKRPICLALTYLLAFGLIALLVLVIIPDIADTIIYIVKSLPSFLTSARGWLVDVAKNFNIPESQIPQFNLDAEALTKSLQTYFSGNSKGIVDGALNITSSLVSGIYNTIFSIVISIYILAQKEKIGRVVKQTIDTFAPKKIAYTIYYISVRTSETFSKFIGGQLIEAAILGMLCYVGMLIFGFPNAPVVSVFIAATALIPIVGAFAGVFIGFLLILISSPIKAVFFVIFMLILQQIEGNLIYPKVVGKAVGLPAVVVISAVLVGGNVGGILGSLLSVPLSAVMYTILKEAIDKPKNKTKA